MAHQFQFDPAQSLLIGNLSGEVGDDELADFYRAVTRAAEKTSAKIGIADFSGVTAFNVSSQMVQSLALTDPAIPNPNDRPRVIVAPRPKAFGIARMFQILGESKRPGLRVVRSREEAYAVLGIIEPKLQAID